MITLIAAAVLAAQPAPAGNQAPQPQPAEHKAMECCKDCCKDMAKGHEGHGSEHKGHSPS